MSIIPKQHILKVKPYVGGKPIDEVKRELGLKKVVKLASNENPYPPSKRVLTALCGALSQVNRYPDGNCFYLRKELARRLRINDDQLIFGNGSDEIIVLAVRAFVRPGDEVILARPSFLIYEIASLLEGARVRAVPLKNFRYDLALMRQAINAKTKIIFIGNPDNPAGTFIDKDNLVSFLNAVRNDILVFIDEAYFEYVRADDYPDGIELSRKYKNVIVTRTFSKMYGLAGLRVGYGVGDAGIVDVLNRLREPFNVNSLAQAAAVACLKDQKYYRGIANAVEKERRFLCAAFAKMGIRYEESFTNFILLKVQSDSSSVARALLNKGVIVRDMSGWGLDQYIRITIGTRDDNIMLAKALKIIMKGNRQASLK